MDTSFSLGLHILILVSESPKAVSSAQIARSAGINPSHVRRLAGLLRNGGLLESRQGVAGFRLRRSVEDITLMDVYCAVHGGAAIQVFPVHRNPSDECLVGRYISSALSDVFAEVDERLGAALRERTLAQVIHDMRRRAVSDGELEE